MRQDTIVALSSGQGRAAIAVIRVSGLRVRFVIETFLGRSLEPRVARLVSFRDPATTQILDRCLALFFPSPASATGEDVLELHVHGSVAVVKGIIGLLESETAIRMAEPGEFSRRALENGKLDLLQVEALGDLLNAETAVQLHQAHRQLSGELGKRCTEWRRQLVGIRADIEAELDFSDEGDVDSHLTERAEASVMSLLSEMRRVLGDAARGARVRDGASVVVVGAPNAGKSMLMNSLSGRDVSIVSDSAGTTRDVLETAIDLGGWPVVLVDTAGLRDSTDAVEREGIRRARERAAAADVILAVSSWDVPAASFQAPDCASVIRVGTKGDLQSVPDVDVLISSVTGAGLDALRSMIAASLGDAAPSEPALIARTRQRAVLQEVVGSLERAARSPVAELMAEDLRHASFGLGRLVGETDLDSVLDHLFQGFCIGK
jgi:tRNA modification GTPase